MMLTTALRQSDFHYSQFSVQFFQLTRAKEGLLQRIELYKSTLDGISGGTAAREQFTRVAESIRRDF